MTSTTATIQVACATDAAFLPHCAAMLHSVLTKHPTAHVHFLCGAELESDALTPLTDMVAAQGGRLHEHRIPSEWIADLPRIRTIPALMWYRIYLPELLPELDKVLYLDADTLVVDDLSELWETPLDGYYLAAVSNVVPEEARAWPLALGMDRAEDYFNSGVLLLNLDAMRADDMPAQLAAFGRAPSQPLKWPDQDALNALMWRRRRALHPRWNCQNSFFYWPQSQHAFPAGQVAEAARNPGILHFEGPHLVKPWHYLNRHPFRELYYEHRRQTPWPRVVPEGRRPLYVLLRPLPTSWTMALFKHVHALRVRLRRWLKAARA